MKKEPTLPQSQPEADPIPSQAEGAEPKDQRSWLQHLVAQQMRTLQLLALTQGIPMQETVGITVPTGLETESPPQPPAPGPSQPMMGAGTRELEQPPAAPALTWDGVPPGDTLTTIDFTSSSHQRTGNTLSTRTVVSGPGASGSRSLPYKLRRSLSQLRARRYPRHCPPRYRF